ncbi:MAG: hypothetical protein H6659_12600 [Ardenticatenaceae bacterium]|nr:hypothetical protein [Ardenticatenaceae bacterium]
MKSILTILSSLLLLAVLAACAPTNGAAGQLPPEVQTALPENEGAYVVLTLPETVTPELEGQLEAAGIRLFDPLGEHRYQAYVPQTAVTALSSLQADDLVQDVAIIDPASKIKGEFANARQTYRIVVQFYEEPTEEETAVLADHMNVGRTAEGVMNFVEGRATGAQIKQLAELPFVKLIEPATRNTGGS